MQRNPSPPAPSTVGRPSGPSTGQLEPLSRNRKTRPSGKATLTWTSCASQFAATASIPMRCSPPAPPSSTTQKLTESRISGSSGFWANTCSRAGSMPPVKSIATQAPCDVVGEQRPNLVEIDAERHRVGVRGGLTLGGGLGPPGAHPRFEFVANRLTQPRVQPADLMNRISLHRAKVDVVEAFIGLAVTETQCPLHADRPVLDVELAEVTAIQMIGETADDIGVEIGHRQDDIGRIAGGHHETRGRKTPLTPHKATTRATATSTATAAGARPNSATSSPAAGRRRSTSGRPF